MAWGELSRALPGFQSVLGIGNVQQKLICSFWQFPAISFLQQLKEEEKLLDHKPEEAGLMV